MSEGRDVGFWTQEAVPVPTVDTLWQGVEGLKIVPQIFNIR